MSKSIENLIKPDKYQVFLMKSRASIPIMFACHPWFVINKKGIISRWEVVWNPQEYNMDTSWGHLGKNFMSPFLGLRILLFTHKFLWKSSLIKMLEGDEGSVASRMIEAVEGSHETYLHKNTYSFLGPNSNTYVQWIINQFPESGMVLPWNCFGKNWGLKQF